MEHNAKSIWKTVNSGKEQNLNKEMDEFGISALFQHFMYILAIFNTFSRSWKLISPFNTFSILSIPHGSPVLGQGSQTRGPRVRFVRPAMLFGNFQIFNIYFAKCLEKRCREINEPKLNDTQCGFHPAHNTTDKTFTLQKIWERLGVRQKRLHMFCRPRESIRSGFLWNSLGSVAVIGCDVDGRLLLTVKSLYSCSKVCVRVGRNKSPPFTVGIGLRQGCVLSPLLISDGQTTGCRPV